MKIKRYNINDALSEEDTELFLSAMKEMTVKNVEASQESKQQKMKRLINGAYAKESKVIAFCHNQIHRGYLTKNLIESHKCFEKECTFFKKVNDNYWRSIEGRKRAKKARRSLIKNAQMTKSSRDQLIREVLEESGHTYVTTIRETAKGKIIVSYIRDMKIDLFPAMVYLKKNIGRIVEVRHRNTSDEVIEALIRKPRRESQNVTDVRIAPLIGDAAKKRLEALGVYCLEDLFGRDGEKLYEKDCEMSGKAVNRRYLAAYISAVEYANEMAEQKDKMPKEPYKDWT